MKLFKSYNTDDKHYRLLEKSEDYSIIRLLGQLTESSSSML